MTFPTENAGDHIWVKICGITNLADALVAIDAGADGLGFVFFPGSKRYVDPRIESDWMSGLPRQVTRIAVMVNPTWGELITAAALPFIDAIQLHGRESPQFCERVAGEGISFSKALPADIATLTGGLPVFHTKNILLDSSTSRKFGGTGETFDWQLGRQFVASHAELNVIIAGGLSPQNVASAIREIRPRGVDVTTGVERSPGRKDPHKIRDFVAVARAT